MTGHPHSAADTVVGANLRRFRLEAGLSQQHLAAQIGVSFQQLQKYERGQNRITAGRLWQFSRILDRRIGAFFEGCGDDPCAARPPITPEAGRLIQVYDPLSADLRRAILHVVTAAAGHQCVDE